jgi:hypothetical protein
MDVSLATAIVSAKSAEVQLAVATKILRMNAQTARSVVQLIDAAQENFERLTNVAAGIGENLDISA